MSQLWGGVALFLDHFHSLRKSGQISGGRANGEMTHIHTNTHTENGHWKLKARATLPTWGSTFSYINERERVEEKHRGDVKSLDIKSRKSRSYKHPTDLKWLKVSCSNDTENTAFIQLIISRVLKIWKTITVMCVWLSLLTHDSEGPSDKPEQLGDFVKKLITLLSGASGKGNGNGGDWLWFKGWISWKLSGFF